MSDKPFGDLGDLVEQLVPIAADLVQIVREEGPDAVRGALLRVPKVTAARLDKVPGGAMGVLAVVLAAMVDPDAGMVSLLGWTDAMAEERARIERAERVAGELRRLQEAGVRSETGRAAAATLAAPAAEQQQAIRGGMLRIIHGERTA